MWLEWRDDRITFIRDYRYARYVVSDAELVLAADNDAVAGTHADGPATGQADAAPT
jgi:RNA polymerase sigma-70 factor (ECF subfamily)